MSVNIIGISALFHDAACCILQDGKLKAAAQEERFTRIKSDPSMPGKAFLYCLREAGISLPDVDCIAYYEDPVKKLDRQLWSGAPGNSKDALQLHLPSRVTTQIREILGYEGEIKIYDHHTSHAASSYFFSGYEEAAILTVDGVGEWATTTYGTGKGNKIEIFEEVRFPDSLGMLYSALTSYLGFEVNEGEYKVMGLAPYGEANYLNEVRQLVQVGENGQYSLDMQYFGFLREQCMYTDALCRLFGAAPRRKDSVIQQFHKDIAKSLQVVLEEILIDKAHYLYRKTGMKNLCMAGGVALNCVANGQILKKGPFNKLFVQPAANDAGGALGAAAMAHMELTGGQLPVEKLQHVYLGPSFSTRQVRQLLQSTSLNFQDFQQSKSALLQATANRLAEGKVIGWFQGRMEFGPRSLGTRSILADPRNAEMRDRINAMVKKREGFRPFAPAVLDYRLKDHFQLDHDSPYMLETCQVISPIDLPAITHIDGSARVQTVHRETNRKFYELLTEFYHQTDCPILLNTSFNVKGEPIVCTPEDALRCFVTTDIDCLVIDDFIIDRVNNQLEVLEFIIRKNTTLHASAVPHDVYTFF